MTGSLLKGKTIFLSASVPSREEWVESTTPEAGANIRNAVICCTRRILFEGGNLVFGGHPTISPFILSVAQDYLGGDQPGHRPHDPRIVIYQSLAFPDNARPEATSALIGLGAQVVSTDPVGGECFEPAGFGKEQCLQSLLHMRERMIGETEPVAMIIIGGMEGILRELAVFRDQRKACPIISFASTGGMASQIHAPKSGRALELLQELRLQPSDLAVMPAEELLPGTLAQPFPPYLLLSARVIEKIASS